jgi:hypothetical protein
VILADYTIMEKLIGRTEEQKILEKFIRSSEAELLAEYGRCRVGKTFLIHAVFEKQISFEFSGIHGIGMKEQLQNFSFALKKAMRSSVTPAVWMYL